MSICRLFLVGLLALMPGAALAHTGHGVPAGLAAGLTHPLAGPDHLAAMVAVGLLAAHLGGQALLLVPLAFVLAVGLAGAAAGLGMALPVVELGILLSVVAFGLLLLLPRALPTLLAAGVVAAFAVFHGAAHGAEMPAGANGLAYGAGFLLATAALHGAGIGAGLTFARISPAAWARVAGVWLVLTGIGLGMV